MSSPRTSSPGGPGPAGATAPGAGVGAPSVPASSLRHFNYELAVFLPAPPNRVWAAFTLETDQWWTYRLRERARCVIEPGAGGRWLQAWDGGGALFGTFVVWDPPHLLVVNGPLAMARLAQNRLELQFDASGDGTRVTVRHEAFGDVDAGTEESYANGWHELIGTNLRDHLARR